MNAFRTFLNAFKQVINRKADAEHVDNLDKRLQYTEELLESLKADVGNLKKLTFSAVITKPLPSVGEKNHIYLLKVDNDTYEAYVWYDSGNEFIKI